MIGRDVVARSEGFEPMADDGELCVFYGTVRFETEKALHVEVAGHPEPVWIPKSQLDEESDIEHRGDAGVFYIPAWLAKEKGLFHEADSSSGSNGESRHAPAEEAPEMGAETPQDADGQGVEAAE